MPSVRVSEHSDLPAVCAAHGINHRSRLDALLTGRLTDLVLGGVR